MILKHLGYVLVLIYWIREVTVEKVLPQPLDLSMSWYNEFCVNLSWNTPKDLDKSCQVKYLVNVTRDEKIIVTEARTKTFERCITLKGVLHFLVQTECNKSLRSRSPPVIYTIDPPTELVKNFQCFLISSEVVNCIWIPVNQAVENLHLYYSYPTSQTTISNISRCSEYQYHEGKKTGCDIRGYSDRSEVFFQVNGTVNGSSVRNTYQVILRYNVKVNAPKVQIRKEGKELILSWDTPNLSAAHCWNYYLNYSKCQENLSKLIDVKQPEEKIPYDPRCQYRVQVKAVYSNVCGEGGSDWSQVAIYGEEDQSYLSIVIPATLFLLVILFLCCFMKHREKLFPKIPQPSLIFKDILHNNKEQKNFIGNLYVPVEEDVECKITLEKEPPLPIMQPDS